MKQTTTETTTLSPREAAARWGLTTRRVRQMCQRGEIPGVTRLTTPYGPMYRIPADARPERRTA